MFQKYKYWYCLLPGGNRDDFPLINKQLRKLGIKAQYAVLTSNGRLYRIPNTEIHKLPKESIKLWKEYVQDKSTHRAITSDAESGIPQEYLPIEPDSGHAIYRFNDEQFVLRRYNVKKWRSI